MLDRTDHNRLAEQTNGRLAMGGNNPPGVIDSAKEAMAELSVFTENNPVIENFDGAKQYAAYIERTRVALNAMEDERKPQAEPLNAAMTTSLRLDASALSAGQVASISNEGYWGIPVRPPPPTKPRSP